MSIQDTDRIPPPDQAPQRDERVAADALLDLLTVQEKALRQAIRTGDPLGAGNAVAARVACWIALADLADDVHPAYALACRTLARWEHESGATYRPIPAPARPPAVTTPGRGRRAARHPVPGPRRELTTFTQDLVTVLVGGPSVGMDTL